MPPTPEANENKIETLTKIARLLSEQLKEQNNKIALLQKEIATLKVSVGQSPQSNLVSEVASADLAQQSSSDLRASAVSEASPTPPIHSSRSGVTSTDISEIKDSEKKELMAALKIIDNL